MFCLAPCLVALSPFYSMAHAVCAQAATCNCCLLHLPPPCNDLTPPLVTCTVHCSRTTGSAVIRNTITSFLAVFPNPTAVLQASDAAITDLIHPLGLQPSRLAAVKGVSHAFLATDWQDPLEFHGCGKFVADSWRIFCIGVRSKSSECCRGCCDKQLSCTRNSRDLCFVPDMSHRAQAATIVVSSSLTVVACRVAFHSYMAAMQRCCTWDAGL